MTRLYTWTTRSAEIVLVLVIGGIFLLAWFLYQSYYQSVTFTQRIVDLSSVVARIDIDEARIKKVTQTLDDRQALQPLDPKNIKNPFK